MTDEQLREVLDRHLPGPPLDPENAPPEAEYCCTYCSHWDAAGSGHQEPWPCDAYRLAEWMVNRRALPTPKQLADHNRAQRRVRSYVELFPGG